MQELEIVLENIKKARILMSDSMSLAHILQKRAKEPIILLGKAQQLQDILLSLRVFCPDYKQSNAIFPAVEHYVRDAALLQAKTMSALYKLSTKKNPMVWIPYTQLFLSFPNPSIFEDTKHSITLYKGLFFSYSHFLSLMSQYGYIVQPMVYKCTQMAYRGDIIDIYPPDAYCNTTKGGFETLPLRIEFFGDVIEDIRIFNKDNQRFIKQVEQHTFYPIAFGALSRPYHDEVALGPFSYLPASLYSFEQSNLFTWLPSSATYFCIDEGSVTDSLEEAATFINEYYQSFVSQDSAIEQDVEILSKETVLNSLEKEQYIKVEILSSNKNAVNLQSRFLHHFRDICPEPESFEKPWKSLVERIHVWKKEYRQIILVFKSERNREAFINLAEQEELYGYTEYSNELEGLFFCLGDIEKGAILSFAKIIIIPEPLLYPHYRAKKGSKKAFKGLEQYNKLEEGMYIIHRDYGVGIYRGLYRLSLSGSENDYILLEYANEDKVYIPVYQIGVLQIHAQSEEEIALDTLGGASWKNSISKAKKAIEAIAEDLIAMYAERKHATKYRYGAYTELYREFEMAFAFEETPDQAKAIEEVLEDMDKAEPMDRLVCGDVGFGKTEVAIRACVRAGLDGRQVAFLCPTTILAEQHYKTIQQRISMLPLRVGLLSRFVDKKEQKKVIEDLSKGMIDIVVGTHRILSKDIEMPNLSLLVLDEEHRFGVRHKEQLKLLRSSIDTLTLTATPIPRTLQLSMSGIRGLSVIETPPQNRKAVESFLCEGSEQMLREAVELELARSGQVFWVYNRVRSIEERYRFIQRLCPHARIGIVHGQMQEKALEHTMRAFWYGEIDVLLATTIIESGIDFPLANTIIIDSAHTYGLNQLYQLRGRVGRGDRQGYAYFVIPEKKVLSELAMDRLQSILSYDYLGAGFQVAMEDLRIRGAGNILGEAQSGHIERIGVELYLEMLEEAVQQLQKNPTRSSPPLRSNVDMNISLKTYIPEDYIQDEKERVYYYKKIATHKSYEEREDIRLELQDRFGRIPEQVETLFRIVTLQELFAQLGVSKATIQEKKIVISWKEGQMIVQPEDILQWVKEHKEHLIILPPSSVEFRVSDSMAQALRIFESLLEGLQLVVNCR